MFDSNKEKVEELNAEELNDKDFKNIRDKIILEEDEKKLKFYEKLRKKLNKLSKDKIGNSGSKIVDYLFLLPDFFILLCRLAVDDRVTVGTKAFVAGVIAYVIMPIDILPDFIPVVGYVDDLVLVVYALNQILNNTSEQILLDNWSGSRDLLEMMQKIIKISEKVLDKNILQKIKKWLRGKH